MKKLLSLIFALSLFLHTGLTLAQGITFNEGDINVQVSGETISGTVNAGKINALSGKKVTVGIKIFPSDATKEMVENGAAPIQTYENIVPGDAGGTANAPFSTTFSASDLDPKKNYPFAVTISIDGAVSVTKLGEINTGDGVVATQRKIDLDLGKKSYRLLAPIPGMSMLLDPDLCIEKKEQDPTTICDINDFINFVLKLLIGLAAVVLVVRLIIEGYVYMTTDVLFLKAGAKKTFFDALLGLVVALASYLILNTINPKLVENSLDVPTSTFGVEEDLAIAFARSSQDRGTLTPEQIKEMRVQYGNKWAAFKDHYIPARDRALPNISKGAKTLMTAQAFFEGFYPGSCSWRTNNPGNIGNFDCSIGSTSGYATLEEGIKKQYDHLSKIVNNANNSYLVGKRYTLPAVKDSGVWYPGVDINPYKGTLQHYLWVYAAGTRPPSGGVSYKGYNNYLSFILSFFKKEGIPITEDTTMSQIFFIK